MKHVSEQEMATWLNYKGKDDFITWGFEFYKEMLKVEEIAQRLMEIRKGFSIEAVKMEAKAESNSIDPKTALVTVQDFYKQKAEEISKALTQLADNSGIDEFWQRMLKATKSTYDGISCQ